MKSSQLQIIKEINSKSLEETAQLLHKTIEYNKSFIRNNNYPLLDAINRTKDNFIIPNKSFLDQFQKLNEEICDFFKINISQNIAKFLNNDNIKNILDSATNTLVQNCAILGLYGWSYYFIDDIDNEDITATTAPKYFKDFLDNTPQATIKSIDVYIGKKIKKKTLLDIILKTEFLLDDVDKVKLKNALKHYNARRYYDCSSLLLGMIDSQNIKQELYDLENNNYSELNKHQGIENVDQGWNAFVIVFRNHLLEYFNNKNFIGKNKNNKSKDEHFEEFVNNVKYDMDYDIGFYFLCIAYPLLTLFKDYSWKEHNKNNKPSVINRNWLMHGMYSIDDIDKFDCIKLFLILYQISNLYYKIKNNSLNEEEFN